MKPLAGKVALVAGATRGAGRGIATALGDAGATVYCTGRSSRASPGERKETIEETADIIVARGGRAIPVRVDHMDEGQVKALFERVRSEQGKLDILVNDIWGGDALTQWGKPFWEQDVGQGIRMMRTAVETHLITSRYGVPLMVEKGEGLGVVPQNGHEKAWLARHAGLVVEITDGDSGRYRGTLYYDLVKNGIIRLANAMHEELKEKGVTALAVTPGFLRSEAMLDLFGVTEENWREGARTEPHFIASETPLFVGRAVAALAADAAVAKKGGRVWASWTLSDEYGFTDADGSRPHWGRYWKATFGDRWLKPLDDTFYGYWGGLDELKSLGALPPDT